MKRLIPEFTLLLASFLSVAPLFAQGGWTHITDANNDISGYTSTAGYVGVAWIDIDNDGHIDLFAAPSSLYYNNGNGKFSPIPNFIGSGAKQPPAGCSWADLDNDGNVDCVLASFPSAIYYGDGGGSFTNVTAQVSDMNNYAAWGCAVGNPRSEHQLDIIFVHASGFHPNATREPCRLYKQRSSSPQLERITGYHFTDTLAPYTVPYWSDYDLDGDMDLFIASGPAGTPGPDFCYRNMRIETGRDTLVRMTTELFASQAQDGQCYNFIDIDNDSDLDLCLTNYAGVSTRMYRNNSGVWTLLPTPFSAVARNLANCWGDYDNDGDLDVIITSDNAVSKYYRNDGDATFTYLTTGFTTPAGASGIASCDYDNDGDLDLFVNGKTPATGLFRNDTVAGTHTWVNLKLVGVESNTSAIGAIVRIKTTIDGKPVWQLREINAQNSFQSQNDLRVHFGLKNAGAIDSLMINWPSGHRDVITNLPVNTFYRVVEGAGIPSLSIPTDKKVDQTAVTIYPNPAGDRIEIMLEGQDTSIAYDISDITGRQIRKGSISPALRYIDISMLPSGTYSIVFRTSNGVVYRSMIKK